MSETKNYTIRVGVVGDQAMQRFQRSVDKLNRSAQTSQTRLQRMGRQMDSLSTAARRLGPLIASAFSVQAVKNVIQTADAIGKVADATGLTIEGYQELKFAAEQSGVSQSQFNSNMTAFVKRVGEARAGTGPLVSGLKNINTELLESIKAASSQEEALSLLADGMSTAGDAADKAAIANAAFGRSGVNMVNMLRDGSDGLNEMTRQARDLGLVMDRDLVRSAESMNDALNVLKTRLQVAFGSQILTRLTNFRAGFAAFKTDLESGGKAAQTAAAAFATLSAVIAGRLAKSLIILSRSNPFTSIALAATTAAWLIIENWDKVAAWFQFKLPAFLNTALSWWADILARILKVIQDWAQTAVDMLVSPFNTFLKRVGELKGGQALLDKFGLKELKPEIDLLNGAIEKMADVSDRAFDRAGDAADRYNERMQKIRESSKDVEESVKGTQIALEGMASELENVNDKAGDTADELSYLESSVKSYEKSILEANQAHDLYQAKFKRLNELLEKGAITNETYRKSVEDLKGTIHESNKAIKESEEALEEFGQEKDRQRDNVVSFARIVETAMGQTISNSIREMVNTMFEGGKSIGEILKDMIKNFAQLVVEMLAVEAAAWAVKKAMEAMGGAGGGGMFGGGGGGGGGFGSILGGIAGGLLPIPGGSIIGAGLGSLLPFAKGGAYQGMIAPYGAIVNKPTKIGFGPLTAAARGMLIGEAGAEAVLPLKRGASGRLGVEAASSAVTVNVHNHTTAQVETVNRATVGGGRSIDFIISDAVRREFKRGGFDRTMRGDFGAKRRGY